jgi:hypothetical protein
VRFTPRRPRSLPRTGKRFSWSTRSFRPVAPWCWCESRPLKKGLGEIAAQPATQHYADLTARQEIVHEPTVAAVGKGLLEGRYETGIALASLVDEHPEEFEVQELIGAVCHAWVAELAQLEAVCVNRVHAACNDQDDA